jgi:hypothetical protein
MAKNRLMAYQKLLRAALNLCAALYELVTGEPAPTYRDVLAEREKG